MNRVNIIFATLVTVVPWGKSDNPAGEDADPIRSFGERRLQFVWCGLVCWHDNVSNQAITLNMGIIFFTRVFRAMMATLFVAVATACTSISTVHQDSAPDETAATSSVEQPDETKPLPAVEPEQQIVDQGLIAVIVSDEITGYTSIADRLSNRLKPRRVSIINLLGERSNIPDAVESIRRLQPRHIVAVGLLAAKAGSQVEDVPMTFCQVFNHASNDLLIDGNTGVKFLPPFRLQLEAWQRLSPSLNSVGLIVGTGQEELLKEAHAAASALDVELIANIVGSDKEALYVFKRLVPQIQGFWLMPDNRILSPQVIRDMLGYAEKHSKQVAVFSPTLLKHGALVSFTTDEVDIADQVIVQVNRPTADSSPSMAPLKRLITQVNAITAEKLGLTPPDDGRAGVTKD